MRNKKHNDEGEDTSHKRAAAFLEDRMWTERERGLKDVEERM